MAAGRKPGANGGSKGAAAVDPRAPTKASLRAEDPTGLHRREIEPFASDAPTRVMPPTPSLEDARDYNPNAPTQAMNLGPLPDDDDPFATRATEVELPSFSSQEAESLLFSDDEGARVDLRIPPRHDDLGPLEDLEPLEIPEVDLPEVVEISLSDMDPLSEDGSAGEQDGADALPALADDDLDEDTADTIINLRRPDSAQSLPGEPRADSASLPKPRVRSPLPPVAAPTIVERRGYSPASLFDDDFASITDPRRHEQPGEVAVPSDEPSRVFASDRAAPRPSLASVPSGTPAAVATAPVATAVVATAAVEVPPSSDSNPFTSEPTSAGVFDDEDDAQREDPPPSELAAALAGELSEDSSDALDDEDDEPIFELVSEEPAPERPLPAPPSAPAETAPHDESSLVAEDRDGADESADESEEESDGDGAHSPAEESHAIDAAGAGVDEEDDDSVVADESVVDDDTSAPELSDISEDPLPPLLHKWKVVPTAMRELDGAPPPPKPSGFASIGHARALQTVLWSPEDEAAARAQQADSRTRNPFWAPTDAALEADDPLESTEAAPPSDPRMAAAAYIHDALAYLRTVSHFAAHLDSEVRREFEGRMLGANDRLRRALAVLAAASAEGAEDDDDVGADDDEDDEG